MNGSAWVPRVRTSLQGGVVALACLVIIAAAAMAARPTGRAAASQAATPVAGSDVNRTITVYGEGRVVVTPDMATVTIGVETRQASLAEAQAEATTMMEAIIEAASDAGVDEDDIQTVNYSVSVIQDYDENGIAVAVTGYLVSNQVQLTIRDIDGLGALLESVVDAGANSIYGISFSNSDPTEAASQARRAAVEDARVKADELAAAAGVEIVEVQALEETSSVSQPPMPFQGGAADSQGRAGGSVPIQAGTGEVLVVVRAVYEIE
ncbi:MAG: SIMPL domain-containing protein [Chloroflexota bacterium]|nr:SIMPL domain-containing protein [Chloroflexota bacterium]